MRLPVAGSAVPRSRLKLPDHDSTVAHQEGSSILVDRAAHSAEGPHSFGHPDGITLTSEVIGQLLNWVWV